MYVNIKIVNANIQFFLEDFKEKSIHVTIQLFLRPGVSRRLLLRKAFVFGDESRERRTATKVALHYLFSSAPIIERDASVYVVVPSKFARRYILPRIRDSGFTRFIVLDIWQ